MTMRSGQLTILKGNALSCHMVSILRLTLKEIFNLLNNRASPQLRLHLECKCLTFCTNNLNTNPNDVKKPVIKSKFIPTIDLG